MVTIYTHYPYLILFLGLLLESVFIMEKIQYLPRLSTFSFKIDMESRACPDPVRFHGIYSTDCNLFEL